MTTTPIRRLCVFSGSNLGAHPLYAEAAIKLGELLVQHKIGLVYGGASVGLMFEAARTVRALGGEVIGVMPQKLIDAEIANHDVTELHVVSTMHERKAMMAELSDAFIALPGGMGTLEETAEIWTWNQLAIIEKPCGLLNINGFYNKLLAFLDHQTQEKFMKPEHRQMQLSADTPEALLELLMHYQPLHVTKWIR